MKNEIKRKNLKIYEQNVQYAADIRREALNKAEKEYQDAIKKQKKLYREAMAQENNPASPNT